MFKRGNEGITKAMIEAITKEKIENIDLDQDRNLIRRYPEEKIGIVDLRATLDNGTICDIEVQIADNKQLHLFYL